MYFEGNSKALTALTYILWDADPIAFSIGSMPFRWYSLMWGLSVLLGYVMVRWFFLREGKPIGKAGTLTQYIFFGGLIGARLGMLFYEPEYFLRNPAQILQIWDGGLASHGCIFGTLTALFLFARNHSEFSFWWLLDRASIMVLPLAGLVRLGNLFNHEIIGKPTDLPWGFQFTRSSVASTTELIPRHPSQLYDMLLVFGLFAFFIYVYKRWQNFPDGLFFGLYFTLAFGGRAVLEFWKSDALHTQLLSVPIILLGLAVLLIKTYPIHRKKRLDSNL